MEARMAEITPNEVSNTGTDIVYRAAAAADYIVWDASGVLKIRNAGGAPITLTATGQRTSNYGGTGDKVWTIPNGAAKEFEIAAFDMSRFADANGRVQLVYSAVTSVTVAYVRRSTSY
jgi:hypothetical protein